MTTEVTPSDAALIDPKDNLKITKLDYYVLNNRRFFLKIHTNAGIVGAGEPITEGRARTCAEAVREIEPYLIGKDPRRVVHHWQAIYRHAFYRGGPILTSALSGIDQALWDIKGKALGVPIYELLGGPTRDRIRVYATGREPEEMKEKVAQGFNAFKTGVHRSRWPRTIETLGFVNQAAEHFAAQREAVGPDVDIAIDFHGGIQPQTAALLIKALEPYQPLFIEEPVQCQNVDVMAELARKTHIPIATGERIFTKWGFREILEKGAASILQPDLCHAGGITEGRLIAGMAEAYYASMAWHNPLGPISLASGVQLAASIPNFLIQEGAGVLRPGEGVLKEPFTVEDGFLILPTKPGLGVELDDDYLENELSKGSNSGLNRESYSEDDGSVVDW